MSDSFTFEEAQSSSSSFSFEEAGSAPEPEPLLKSGLSAALLAGRPRIKPSAISPLEMERAEIGLPQPEDKGPFSTIMEKAVEPTAAAIINSIIRKPPAFTLHFGEPGGTVEMGPSRPAVIPGVSTLNFTPDPFTGEKSPVAKAAESMSTPGQLVTLPAMLAAPETKAAKAIEALYLGTMAESVPDIVRETAKGNLGPLRELGPQLLPIIAAHALKGVPNAPQKVSLETGGVAEYPGATQERLPAETGGGNRPVQPAAGAEEARPLAEEKQVLLSPEHQALVDPHLEKYNGVVVDREAGGRIAQANHETGQIEINRPEFEAWLTRDLKDLTPKQKAAAVKDLFEHEDIHLKTDPEDAEPYWHSLSPFEQYVLKRQYLKGATEETPRNLGFEAIRNRVERAMGLTRQDFVGMALKERWTAQSLDALADIVGKIRRLRDKELSDNQKAILDKVMDNIGAARNAVPAAKTEEESQYVEGPFARRQFEEPEEGKVRLYRGHDGGTGGVYWTKDLGYAQRMGPKLEYLDVPADELGDYSVRKVEGSGTPNAFKLPADMTKAAKDYGPSEVPVHELPAARRRDTEREGKGTPDLFGPMPKTGQPSETPFNRDISDFIPTTRDMIRREQEFLLSPEADELTAEELKNRRDKLRGLMEQYEKEQDKPYRVQGPASRRKLEEELPEPPEGERIVIIQRPDKSIYYATYGGKHYDVRAGGPAMVEKYGESPASIAKLNEKGQWSHGMLPKGDKIIQDYSPAARVERDLPAARRKTGKAGEQPEMFGAITRMGVPGEETPAPEERVGATEAGAVTEAPPQKIFARDIGFDQRYSQSPFRPITESESKGTRVGGKKLADLSRILTADSRIEGSDQPVSVTRRATVIQSRTDGSVHIVSTYPERRAGQTIARMVDPDYAGSERPNRPLEDILPKYRPLYSILFREPRQNFHQEFQTLADFNTMFGDEAKQMSRELGTGTEGIPMTSMGKTPSFVSEFGETPAGGKLTKLAPEEAAYPEETEPNLPRPSEPELRDFHDFWGDNIPNDIVAAESRLIREAPKATRQMVNGLYKLMDMEKAQHRGMTDREALENVLSNLYENLKNSETRSEFVQKTMEQGRYGAPKALPPREAPPKTGARELTHLRDVAPTTIPGQDLPKGPGPEYPEATPKPVEFLSEKEQRQLARRLREQPPAARRRIEDTFGKLREYMSKAAANISTAGDLSDQLYRLKTSEKADYDLALPVVRSALKTIPEADRPTLLRYADEMQVLKRSDVKLNDQQQLMYETFLKPLLDDNQKMYQYLRKAGVDAGESTYLGRMVQDPHSLYSRLARGVKQRVTEGTILGQTASFFKRRVFKALEDADGNRRLVALVGTGDRTKVIGYDKGKAQLLGKMPPESLERQAINAKQQRSELLVESRRKAEFDKLDKEEFALMKEKDRLEKLPDSAEKDIRMKGVDDRLGQLNAEYAEVEQKYPDLKFETPRIWKDKSGKVWKFTDATIGEIESNTNTRYYKEPMSGIITQNLKLKQIYRAQQFLDNLRNSPDFQRVSRSVNERNVPADWRTVELPQFRGLRIEPRTADVLDLFAEEQKGPSIPLQWASRVNTFLRNSLFIWNPFVHEPNLLAHWFTARGIEWAKPGGYDRMFRSGVAALTDVMTRSRFRDQALRSGAPLMRGMGRMNREILNLLKSELDANPSMATRVARGLGYINPLRAIRAFGDSLTWGTNEVLTLQLIRETMQRTGLPLEEAIKEVGKHMPNYRIPPRVLNSRLISHVMRNPMVSLWGHYHYGALRSYGEMAKEIFSPSSTAGQRLEGLGRVATIGFLMAVAYPAMDELINEVLKTKGLKIRRAGSTTAPQNIMDLIRGKKTPEAVAQSLVTPAPLTTGAVEMMFNRNLRTGLPIYERRLGMQTAKDISSFAASKISPVEEAGRVFGGKKSREEFGLGLAGITRTRADSAMSRFGRMADDWMRKNPDESIREQYKRRTQDVFQESDYQLLRSAVIREDGRAAQMAINKLLQARPPGETLEKRAEEIGSKIEAWKDSPFTGTRKIDNALMAEMTPAEWYLWYQAAQERLDIANAMEMKLVETVAKQQP